MRKQYIIIKYLFDKKTELVYNLGSKKKEGEEGRMIKLTYTLEAKANCIEDEKILDRAGLKREESRGLEIEDGPFYFTTNSKDEIMNTIDALDEENYELGWILTKKV